MEERKVGVFENMTRDSSVFTCFTEKILKILPIIYGTIGDGMKHPISVN